MRTWNFILIGLIFSACSLSATQEQSLNQQTGQYLLALNSQSVLTKVALTYPPFVAEVNARGATYFKACFGPKSWEEGLDFADLEIKRVEKKNQHIHVHYSVPCTVLSDEEGLSNKAYEFVALSKDQGVHWFFMNYRYYRDKKNCKGLERLLK